MADKKEVRLLSLDDVLGGDETCACGNSKNAGEDHCFHCQCNQDTILMNRRMAESIRAAKSTEEAINKMARFPGVNYIGNK
ncbi:MAG: hypothetical protein PHF50_02050 [Patescibacteria group bacterium]|nr:hypothetical protein [Patescibacteria group bacterium]